MSSISLPAPFLFAYNYLIWDSTEGDIPFDFGWRGVELLTSYLPCACGWVQIGFRLCGSDTIRGLFDSLPSPSLSTTVRPREHKCSPIVIVSICPRLLLLVKRELSFIESLNPYLWYGRFHFHHTITGWLEKQLSVTKEASLLPSVYSEKKNCCISEASEKVVMGFWTQPVVSQWDTMTLSYILEAIHKA